MHSSNICTGVPWEECQLVGALIGLKTIVNEFVAYQRMGEMKAAGLLSVITIQNSKFTPNIPGLGPSNHSTGLSQFQLPV